MLWSGYLLLGCIVLFLVDATVKYYYPKLLVTLGLKKDKESLEYWIEELRKVQAEAEAKGRRLLSFSLNPLLSEYDKKEIVKQLVLLHRAILDGKTRPAPPIGDSHGLKPLYTDNGGTTIG